MSKRRKHVRERSTFPSTEAPHTCCQGIGRHKSWCKAVSWDRDAEEHEWIAVWSTP